MDNMKLFAALLVSGVAVGGSYSALAQGNGQGPANSSWQQAIDALTAELDARLAALEAFIIVDEFGNATIAPTGDLILDANGMTEIMDDTMVMGDATLEGDTLMMEDAEVMGDTTLEGDTMIMEDVMVMGDATLESETLVEGTFVQPFDTANVLAGVLDPVEPSLSSAIEVVDGGFLETIPPAAVVGTNLRLKFAPAAPDRLRVLSCEFVGPGCGAGFENIALKPNSPRYRMSPGDILILNWNGAFWDELARSSGTGAIAELRDSFNVVGGGSVTEAVACDPDSDLPGITVPDGGLENAVLVNGFVDLGGDASLSVDSTELVNLGDGVGLPGGGMGSLGGSWAFSATVMNGSGSTKSFDLAARCLAL